jgi:serine/threonine-protein kinase
MGIVYRAREVTLGRDVAIKTLTRLSPGSARRLTEEGCAMAGLSHSNIAVLYAVEAWRGTPLLIMEYLAGGTLAARLKRGRMGVEDTLQITLQLARALAYVHSTGVYHGDIKPTNIGFTTEGLPKFLDFGLSRSLSLSTSDADPHTEQERSGKIAGTPAYLSPEVLNGGHPGPELDIWALCLVLLEAVTGNHPLLSASITRSSDYVDAISIAVAGGVGHPALHHLLERAFLPGSNRYPQRASDLVRELEQVIAANNPTPEI